MTAFTEDTVVIRKGPCYDSFDRVLAICCENELFVVTLCTSTPNVYHVHRSHKTDRYDPKRHLYIAFEIRAVCLLLHVQNSHIRGCTGSVLDMLVSRQLEALTLCLYTSTWWHVELDICSRISLAILRINALQCQDRQHDCHLTSRYVVYLIQCCDTLWGTNLRWLDSSDSSEMETVEHNQHQTTCPMTSMLRNWSQQYHRKQDVECIELNLYRLIEYIRPKHTTCTPLRCIDAMGVYRLHQTVQRLGVTASTYYSIPAHEDYICRVRTCRQDVIDAFMAGKNAQHCFCCLRRLLSEDGIVSYTAKQAKSKRIVMTGDVLDIIDKIAGRFPTHASNVGCLWHFLQYLKMNMAATTDSTCVYAYEQILVRSIATCNTMIQATMVYALRRQNMHHVHKIKQHKLSIAVSRVVFACIASIETLERCCQNICDIATYCINSFHFDRDSSAKHLCQWLQILQPFSLLPADTPGVCQKHVASVMVKCTNAVRILLGVYLRYEYKLL